MRRRFGMFRDTSGGQVDRGVGLHPPVLPGAGACGLRTLKHGRVEVVPWYCAQGFCRHGNDCLVRAGRHGCTAHVAITCPAKWGNCKKCHSTAQCLVKPKYTVVCHPRDSPGRGFTVNIVRCWRGLAQRREAAACVLCPMVQQHAACATRCPLEPRQEHWHDHRSPRRIPRSDKDAQRVCQRCK
ncbi:hypothetical protein PYCCODRAFT_1120689 [Trametes coccinea BRFM310]|uniref:Uncharacterized protein n=1 Tax=Trametes coccinea (strain BRFM310) TaxID=1353009 RepID=A0A1Y2I8U6_TRAC3|nr:hypothetical protein PYCCODRAFT_1120689 [Trametes coccinea BRFM310]